MIITSITTDIEAYRYFDENFSRDLVVLLRFSYDFLRREKNLDIQPAIFQSLTLTSESIERMDQFKKYRSKLWETIKGHEKSK